MICPFCNEEIKDNTKFCKKCGAKIPRCPSCGMVLKKKMKFCKNDGTPIPEEILQLFDEQNKKGEVAVNEPVPKVTVLKSKKIIEKSQEEEKPSQPKKEEKQRQNYQDSGLYEEEMYPEPDTSAGNKSLIGLLVFFIITFAASLAGLLLLLSGGYVTLF